MYHFGELVSISLDHARNYCCPVIEKKVILLSNCTGNRNNHVNNFLSLSSLSTVRQNVKKGVLSYHDHSFLNQPSELCLDSQVSDHKFPPERDAKLQKRHLNP